jgi:hypothetical protein
MSNRYTAHQVIKLIREELNALTADGVEWDSSTLHDLVEWLDLNTKYVIEDDGEEDAK